MRPPPQQQQQVRADLVLVGGGHAHVQVLRRWMMAPIPGVRLTLVADQPQAVYSGMVPGFVAGDYAAADLEIDLVPLARRAGARLVLAAAMAVDPRAKRIALEGRAAIPYDVASLDVGAAVRGLDLSGVRTHALPTRPIGRFVARLDAALAQARAIARERLRVAVVGAGAAGVELACTLQARLSSRGPHATVTLLTDGDLLPEAPPRVRTRVRAVLEARGIAIRTAAPVLAVEPEAVVLASGRVPADLVIWAAGAAPPSLAAASDLPRDPEGFIRVDPTLAVCAQRDLFAAGDCATIADFPWVPKAGVYAVRQGPILDANLRATLGGMPLAPYRPQREFLRLLNLGGREALGTKRGCVVSGRWVWRWKDRIDRRFVRRFQALDANAEPAPGFPAADEVPMRCGGCAAKLGSTALHRVLARLPPSLADPSVVLGLDARDDAAAIRNADGTVTLATLDAFRSFTDDPWLVGYIAAVNALSDIFAKGGRPRHALALVNVPEAEREGGKEALYQVTAGVRAALDPLGVALLGGHTTTGEELFVGLAVWGDVAPPGALLRLAGAQPGDALLLTKPLGTGLVLAADALGRARGRWVAEAIDTMRRPNAAAAGVLTAHGAHACTDVSGFGLVGHLRGLLEASGVTATIALDRLPLLGGARALLATHVRSTSHGQNLALGTVVFVARESAASPHLDILYDPQTSGGLLAAVPPEAAEGAVAALHRAGDGAAAVIGYTEPMRPRDTIRVVRAI